MTQQDLANRLQLHSRTVAGWCGGESIPHRRTIDRLAVEFGRGPQWFKDEHGYGPEEE